MLSVVVKDIPSFLLSSSASNLFHFALKKFHLLIGILLVGLIKYGVMIRDGVYFEHVKGPGCFTLGAVIT